MIYYIYHNDMRVITIIREEYIRTFENKIRDFALLNNAVSTDIERYKKEDVYYTTVDMLKYKLCFVMGFINYGYSFNITSTNNMGFIVRIKFPFSDIYFSPYDIHNTLELNDFIPLDFHCASDINELNTIMDLVLDFVNKSRVAIEKIADDSHYSQRLVDCYMYDMQIVSKRIFKKGIDENTKKRLRSHEIDLHTHNEIANYYIDFAKYKNSTKLAKHLAKRSAKNKLLLYEQRYYDYLMSHDFPLNQTPSLDFVNKSNEKNEKANKIDIIISLIALLIISIITFAINRIILHFAYADYIVINKQYWFEHCFNFLNLFSAMAALLLFEYINAGRIVKTSISGAINAIDKKTRVIWVLIAAFVIVFNFAYQANRAFDSVGISDNGILYQNTEYAYDNDTVDLFVVDGYFDEERYVEDRDIYYCIDDDKENYKASSLSDKNLKSALNIIEKANPDIKHYKTIDDYLK